MGEWEEWSSADEGDDFQLQPLARKKRTAAKSSEPAKHKWFAEPATSAELEKLSAGVIPKNTVVSRKYALPFATLALVQIAGGAYTRDATFSLAITPSLDREMFSGFVDAGFVLARLRNAPDASGRLASFSIEGRGSRTIPRSSWRVHRCCRRSAFAVDNLTVDSRINLRSIEKCLAVL